MYLFLDDLVVNFPGGNIILAGHCDIKITFVIAKIEVYLSAIIQNEYLA